MTYAFIRSLYTDVNSLLRSRLLSLIFVNCAENVETRWFLMNTNERTDDSLQAKSVSIKVIGPVVLRGHIK